MPEHLKIHEFSTGIEVEAKSGGSWFSRGFTGRYMNQTIEPIPTVIQEAISNKEFSIAEGASSDIPALIGREVTDNHEAWSVIAVVTRGRDESRSFSAYRYFCTEGKGNLGQILRFLGKNPPIFDPFDKKTIGQPYLVNYSQDTNIPLDNFEDLLSCESIPLIVDYSRLCPVLIFNEIAEKIAGDSLCAWAYNVEAVEMPRSFYAIKPSNERAEEIIRKSLSNQSNINKPIFGEQKIKTAITSLCKRNKIKPEYLKTLENALGNPDINEEFWQEIFNGQGIRQAQTQGIYGQDMIRLLTLQTVMLPKTLPKFLDWMLKKEVSKTDHFQISAEFQFKILQELGQNAPNFFF